MGPTLSKGLTRAIPWLQGTTVMSPSALEVTGDNRPKVSWCHHSGWHFWVYCTWFCCVEACFQTGDGGYLVVH